ncbi:MAG: class I SAM-dependent methyltransferase [Acidobacteria bacterium]|nr:class I SAM-dependent methyltransferase [Acidobacteriota bacterium]
MNVEQSYNTWSETYDRDQNYTRDLDEIVTKKTLKDLCFKSILEIGCGTGKNTPLLSEIGEKVQALDLSEGMISKAKEKLKLDNVSFSVANIMTSWPCESKSVDLIVCNLVLEHIEDLSFIFSEASRILVKGGYFFICEFHPFRQYQGKKANFEQNQEVTQITAFVHNISDFTNAAKNNSLKLQDFNEYWHQEDQNKVPRLISFFFEKQI